MSVSDTLGNPELRGQAAQKFVERSADRLHVLAYDVQGAVVKNGGRVADLAKQLPDRIDTAALQASERISNAGHATHKFMRDHAGDVGQAVAHPVEALKSGATTARTAVQNTFTTENLNKVKDGATEFVKGAPEKLKHVPDAIKNLPPQAKIAAVAAGTLATLGIANHMRNKNKQQPEPEVDEQTRPTGRGR